MRLKLKKTRTRKIKKKDWNALRRNSDLRNLYSVEVRNKFGVLEDETEHLTNEEDLEQTWQNIQKTLVDVADNIVPNVAKVARRNWMTQEILDLMERRRHMKGINRERYKELDREIKRKCREKKEEWLNQQCEEIERLNNRDTELMHKKIKEMTDKRGTSRGTVIKDALGNVLMEENEVINRWEEYVKDLYHDNRGDKPRIDENPEIIPIMREEVQQAVKQMKWKKAEGEDGVVIEMVEAGGEIVIQKITELINKIYSSGYIPEQMRQSVFLTIPKKEGAIECGKHRTISIMSQVTKILLRVIRERIHGRVMEKIDDMQFGFRKGKGTRNAIFMLRSLVERTIEKQKDVYMCFVDFEKAFDTVRHTTLIQMLQEIGVDQADVRIIANMYWDQTAAVRIGDNKTNWFEIERGVRQGCVLSPDLFSLYSQVVMDELEDLEGMKIGGMNINNLRYADDTVLLADSQENLQLLINRLDEECRARGLSINTDKTECMGITKRQNGLNVRVHLRGTNIKQVTRFKYLGCIVSEDGRCEEEIKTRIAMSKITFKKMSKIFTNMGISMRTRSRLLKCFVWSVLLYGCETWTISKTMRKRIEAAEMWFWRRMRRIPWTARITNEEVLRRAGEKRHIMTEIRKRQLAYIGHVMRENSVEKNCLLGMVEGRRSRGRQRVKYLDSLRKDVAIGSIEQLARSTSNREEWRSIIANVNIDTALR